MVRRRSPVPTCAIVALFAATLLVRPSASAQLTLNWSRDLSADVAAFEGAKLAVDAAGDVYVAGSTPDGYDLIKYSSNGTLLWSRHHPIGGQCVFVLDPGIAVDPQGNAVLRHRKYDAQLDDCGCALTKYDPDGSELWSTTSDRPCFELAVGPNGDIDLFAHEGVLFWTQKFSSSGIRQWATFKGANYVSYTYGVAGHSDGSVYVLSNGPQSDNDDIVVIKYDSAGVEQWMVRYNSGDRGDDWPGSMVLDADGNVYVAGYSDPDGENVSTNVHDLVALKISAAGALLWSPRYKGLAGHGGSDLWYDPWPAGIARDAQGNVIVAGRVSGGAATKYNFATVKYDANGTELWAREYNYGQANCNDEASDVAIGPDGDAYTVGLSEDACPAGTSSLVVRGHDAGGASIGEDRRPGYDTRGASIEMSPGGTGYVLVGSDLWKFACVALTPNDAVAGHLASTGTVNVVSHGGCSANWTAVSNAPWLTVTSGSSGAGNGTVGYSVAANATGAQRIGIITVGDATFTLTQNSDQCTLTTPSGLVATPVSMSSVVTWTGMPGHRYELQRRYAYSGGWVTVSSDAATPYLDDFLFPYTYLYRVRAVSDCMSTPFSSLDLVTIMSYTDDPLQAAGPVKALHWSQLRTAIDRVREAAYLPNAAYSEIPQAGGAVKASHVNALRARLTEALAALGLAGTFTDPVLGAGTVIRRAHIQELRDATK